MKTTRRAARAKRTSPPPCWASGLPRPNVCYRVEAETGVGWSDSRGRPYPVFTLYQVAFTRREAEMIARKRRTLEPLFGVRIVREVKTQEAVKGFMPNAEAQTRREAT